LPPGAISQSFSLIEQNFPGLYANCFVKRGDIHVALEVYEKALSDYSEAIALYDTELFILINDRSRARLSAEQARVVFGGSADYLSKLVKEKSVSGNWETPQWLLELELKQNARIEERQKQLDASYDFFLNTVFTVKNEAILRRRVLLEHLGRGDEAIEQVTYDKDLHSEEFFKELEDKIRQKFGF
jgi:tetratricopeptide (TPR) repeat protein